MTDIFEIYKQMRNAVDEIDSKLDLLTDQKSATRSRVMKELIEANATFASAVGNQIKDKLSTAPTDTKIGMYFGLVRFLSENFGKELNTELDKLVESAPVVDDSEKPTPEQAKALGATRSDLYTKIKSLIETASNFGAADGMEMPKKRSGGRGPRGARASSFITWTIDGESVEGLKAVVEKYDTWDKVSELRAAMKEKEINLTTPPPEFEFSLPDGKILKGVYSPPAPTDVDDEDEDESEDSTDDEAATDSVE